MHTSITINVRRFISQVGVKVQCTYLDVRFVLKIIFITPSNGIVFSFDITNVLSLFLKYGDAKVISFIIYI